MIEDCYGNSFDGFFEEFDVAKLVSQFEPLNVSLVLAKSHENYVLIYNRVKKHWEIPGGFIEPEESPENAAFRELKEETGFVAANMKLCGVMRIFSRDRNRKEYCAVFMTEIDDSQPFVPNPEASKLAMWNGVSEFNGYINELDVALIKIHNQSCKLDEE